MSQERNIGQEILDGLKGEPQGINQVAISLPNGAKLIMRESSGDGRLIVSVFDGCQWAYVVLSPAEVGAVQVFLNAWRRDRDFVEDLKEYVRR